MFPDSCPGFLLPHHRKKPKAGIPHGISEMTIVRQKKTFP